METKTSLNHENPPIANVLLPAVLSTVFEQYEFKGWLITIENYRGTDELIGFAIPTKYAHLLNADNYYYIDEIAEENGIESKVNEDGDEYYEDLTYIIAEPDDVVVNFLAKIETTKASCVLDFMVKEILKHTTQQDDWERYLGISRFDDTEIVKTDTKKINNTKSRQKENWFFASGLGSIGKG